VRAFQTKMSNVPAKPLAALCFQRVENPGRTRTHAKLGVDFSRLRHMALSSRLFGNPVDYVRRFMSACLQSNFRVVLVVDSDYPPPAKWDQLRRRCRARANAVKDALAPSQDNQGDSTRNIDA